MPTIAMSNETAAKIRELTGAADVHDGIDWLIQSELETRKMDEKRKAEFIRQMELRGGT